MYVHNLSAVGEQYLDFEPPTTGAVRRGRRHDRGRRETRCRWTRPTCSSSSTLRRLGRQREPPDRRARARPDVQRHRGPLQKLLDCGGSSSTRPPRTTRRPSRLLEGRTVLRTQRGQTREHQRFAGGLDAGHPRPCADSDGDLRGPPGRPGTVRRSTRCSRASSRRCRSCSSNVVSVNQVVVAAPGLEQLLVTYPALIAGGFTGTTADGYGHVNLQFANKVQPCTKGYMPQPVAPGRQLTDAPIYPAECQARGAVQHARHEVRPGRRARTPDRRRCTVRRTTREPDWSRAPSTLRETPYESSRGPGTCRCWEGIRGSGSWWGRWRAVDGRATH